jgi:hypothetical protein
MLSTKQVNKKTIIITFALIAIPIIALFCFYAWFSYRHIAFRYMYNPKPVKIQRNMNFLYKTGIGGGDELNTNTNIFTKDMIMESPVKAQVILSESQFGQINNKLIQMDFEAYPNSCETIIINDLDKNHESVLITPDSEYTLTIESGGKSKTIICTGSQLDELMTKDSQKLKNLKELFEMIDNMIYSNPNYKKLPKPKASYI